MAQVRWVAGEGVETSFDTMAKRYNDASGQWDYYDSSLTKDTTVMMEEALLDHYMLLSPLQGALLTSEVGTGKTLIYGTVLLMQYLRLQKLDKEGKPVEAIPSIIVLPSSLVPQTFAELQGTFSNLDFYCWYDTAGDIAVGDARRPKTTLTQETFDKLMENCVAKRGSPSTARKVIIAAHTTITTRWATRHQLVKHFRQSQVVRDAVDQEAEGGNIITRRTASKRLNAELGLSLEGPRSGLGVHIAGIAKLFGNRFQCSQIRPPD
ncbi:hypothetical protein N0V85_009485 [Neurospora sp. IMI 360204]|nr:hypothetical protein N0V85_009485 [Neurospora sp. IMI 360204]